MPGTFVLWHRSLGLEGGEQLKPVSIVNLRHFFPSVHLFTFSFSKTEPGNENILDIKLSFGQS